MCKQGRIEDVLGIWQLSVPAPKEVSYRAYPLIPDIELGTSHRNKRKSEGEQYNPNLSGNDVTEVHDLRDYQKGDALNRIHWKLSSKLDQIIVREFGNPTSHETVVLYDGAFAGYQDNHTAVNGVLGMTAALSRAMIRGDRPHKIAYSYHYNMKLESITNENEMMNCLTDLLGCHLSGMELQSALLEEKVFTEHVILVTGCLDEAKCNRLGEKTELSVVLLTDGDKAYIEERHHYKILAVPLQGMNDRIHQIEI